MKLLSNANILTMLIILSQSGIALAQAAAAPGVGQVVTGVFHYNDLIGSYVILNGQQVRVPANLGGIGGADKNGKIMTLIGAYDAAGVFRATGGGHFGEPTANDAARAATIKPEGVAAAPAPAPEPKAENAPDKVAEALELFVGTYQAGFAGSIVTSSTGETLTVTANSGAFQPGKVVSLLGHRDGNKFVTTLAFPGQRTLEEMKATLAQRIAARDAAQGKAPAAPAAAPAPKAENAPGKAAEALEVFVGTYQAGFAGSIVTSSTGETLNVDANSGAFQPGKTVSLLGHREGGKFVATLAMPGQHTLEEMKTTIAQRIATRDATQAAQEKARIDATNAKLDAGAKAYADRQAERMANEELLAARAEKFFKSNNLVAEDGIVPGGSLTLKPIVLEGGRVVSLKQDAREPLGFRASWIGADGVAKSSVVIVLEATAKSVSLGFRDAVSYKFEKDAAGVITVNKNVVGAKKEVAPKTRRSEVRPNDPAYGVIGGATYAQVDTALDSLASAGLFKALTSKGVRIHVREKDRTLELVEVSVNGKSVVAPGMPQFLQYVRNGEFVSPFGKPMHAVAFFADKDGTVTMKYWDSSQQGNPVYDVAVKTKKTIEKFGPPSRGVGLTCNGLFSR